MRIACNLLLAAWLFYLAPDLDGTSGTFIIWAKVIVVGICLGLSLSHAVRLAKWICEVRAAFDKVKPK